MGGVQFSTLEHLERELRTETNHLTSMQEQLETLELKTIPDAQWVPTPLPCARVRANTRVVRADCAARPTEVCVAAALQLPVPHAEGAFA